MKPITEKHKLYFLIAMLLLAVLIGYMRFMPSPQDKKQPHLTSDSTPSPSQTSPSTLMPKHVSHIGPATKRFTRRPVTRNIFKPSGPLPPMPTIQQPSDDTSTPVEMTLSGTLTGSASPMAIINDQFMVRGQKIGQYRITRIAHDRVYLTSEKETVCLKVLSLAQAITPIPPRQPGDK